MQSAFYIISPISFNGYNMSVQQIEHPKGKLAIIEDQPLECYVKLTFMIYHKK